MILSCLHPVHYMLEPYQRLQGKPVGTALQPPCSLLTGQGHATAWSTILSFPVTRFYPFFKLVGKLRKQTNKNTPLMHQGHTTA